MNRNGTHFTTEQIMQTLKNMKVMDNEGIFYKACYSGSDVLDALEQIFNLGINRKNYLPVTLNKIAKKYQDYSSHTTYNQHAKSLDYSISMLFSRLLLTHQVSKMGLYF